MSSVALYVEGDRCDVCGHYYWERDGGWHSLIPITFADTPELVGTCVCPRCLEDADARIAAANSHSGAGS